MITRRKFLKAIGIASLAPSVIPKLLPTETIAQITVPTAVRNYNNVLGSDQFVKLLDKHLQKQWTEAIKSEVGQELLKER